MVYASAGLSVIRRQRAFWRDVSHIPRDLSRLVRHGLGVFPPCMTEREAACYKSLLSRSSRLVEYGVGGSTVLACSLQVPHITAVESDLGWIKRVRNNASVRAAEQAGRLSFVHVDIGPTGKVGRPVSAHAQDSWPLYPAASWDENTTPPDLVLIDGRFRVACAMHAVLKASEATIVIHDFFSRPKYHVVLGFLDQVAAVDDLAVFRRKAAIDTDEAEATLRAYQYLWD